LLALISSAATVAFVGPLDLWRRFKELVLSLSLGEKKAKQRAHQSQEETC
jgi:hypothetical protein